MDSFEINKIVAAILMVALLIIGIAKISDVIFHVEKPKNPGYSVEVEQVVSNSNSTTITEEKDQNSASADNLRVLENIDVRLTVEVGSAELKIKELLRLNEGSVIELDRLAGDPLDILVNGTMIAKGEVVMVGERFGIRFVEIVDPQKRIESVK